jgi:hypothetical protein
MQSETPLTSSYEATFESYAELYESMQIPPPPPFWNKILIPASHIVH